MKHNQLILNHQMMNTKRSIRIKNEKTKVASILKNIQIYLMKMEAILMKKMDISRAGIALKIQVKMKIKMKINHLRLHHLHRRHHPNQKKKKNFSQILMIIMVVDISENESIEANLNHLKNQNLVNRKPEKSNSVCQVKN